MFRGMSLLCALHARCLRSFFFLFLIFFFLIHRSHSISFTRAQGIPKYKIGFGREKDGKVGERLVEGGGALFPPCGMPLMVSVGVACLSALLWVAESWQPIKATPAHVSHCRALWRDALAAGVACEVPFIAIPAPDLSDNTFTGPTLYVQCPWRDSVCASACV
jgi:hypothetical protein